MADIAMCLEHDCPRANECYRHEAPANELWQSYQKFDPENCEDFLPIYRKGEQ